MAGTNSNCEFASLLGKPVRIETNDNRKEKVVYGNLYTVDPASGDVFLIAFGEDRKAARVDWLPGSSVLSVSSVAENEAETLPGCVPSSSALSTQIANLFNSSPSMYSPEECVTRKKRLCDWLRLNFLPVVERDDGSLLIHDLVSVTSPYGEEQCLCDNAIVLNRIRRMVASVPKE